MDASLAHGGSSFLERAGRLMERVEHRCAVTAQDNELIYRTRYSTNPGHSLIRSRRDGRIFDEDYDTAPNLHNIMTFLDDEFVGVFRIHVDTGQDAILPSLPVFGDVLMPMLREERVLVDVTRIATKLEYAVRFPELPYLTIRAVLLAAEHFRADFIILACFSAHQGFYSRVFGFESLCLPRACPQLARARACMALDYRAKKDWIENRHPIFRSSEAERLSLYGPHTANRRWPRFLN
jgi:hypothetical protein